MSHNTPRYAGVRPEGPTASDTQPASTQVWVNRSVQASILDIGPNVAWYDKMVLDEVVCTKSKEGWLSIIKAHRGAIKRVAYVGGGSYAEALELAAEFAARGCLTWQKPKRPPWLRKQTKP